MRQMCALVAVLGLAASCGRDPRPLVLMVSGDGDVPYWRLAQVGGIRAALEQNVDIAFDHIRGRRPAGYVIGPGVRVPGDTFAVALQVPLAGPSVRAEVSADYHGGGEDAARWVGEMMVGEGDIAVLAATLEEHAAKARIEGFVSAVKQHFPGMRIVHTEAVGSNSAEAKEAMARLLRRYGGLRVLYADSEPVALGAVDLLKARANTKVRMIAYAKSDPLIDDLKARVIDGLLVEDIVGAGYAAVSAVVRARRGESVPRQIRVPMHVVRRVDMEKPEIIELLRPDVQGWHSRLKTRI